MLMALTRIQKWAFCSFCENKIPLFSGFLNFFHFHFVSSESCYKCQCISGRFQWRQQAGHYRTSLKSRDDFSGPEDQEMAKRNEFQLPQPPREPNFNVGIYILIRKWIRENQANSSKPASTAPSTRCSQTTWLSSIRQRPGRLPVSSLTISLQNTLVMTPMNRLLHKISSEGCVLHSTSRPFVILYCFYLQNNFLPFFRPARLACSILNQVSLNLNSKNILFDILVKLHLAGEQIQYNQRMINPMTLNDAVSKVYGKSLVPCGSPMSEWQLFMPFSMRSNDSTILLRLLEVPAYLYTSEQICEKRREKFKEILHEVRLIFVERCFQSSYYLLIAEENLFPVSSLLKVKKQAGEKVDESIILDYLEFVDKLQAHPFANQISFDENQIGVNSKGNFILANYLMYFQDIQKTQKKNQEKKEGSLKEDARNVLARLIMPNSEVLDYMTIYDNASQKYGQIMAKVVAKFMEPSFCFTQISQLVSERKNSKVDQSFSATITDTCVEDCEKISENFMNDTCNTGVFEEGFRKQKKHDDLVNRRKVIAFVVVFIIILIGIGAITFTYLKPRPLECDESQYADQTSMKCLSCDPSCEKCIGEGNTMCVSCRGSLFLILRDSHDKSGRCSEDCHGTIIKTKTCIDNH